jgi:hypothetical protein
MIKSPWAVLLCKFSDDSTEPFPKDFYEDLFTASGVGSQNMVDYFRDVSHEKLDLSDSRVFGWYTRDKKRSEYTGSGPNPDGRRELINWARQAAAADNDDPDSFSKFKHVGVVVCMNVPTDLFGGAAGVVCDNGSMEPRFLGQEMGHLYGLAHSRADGSTADYQDQWDVMSVMNAFSAPHPRYTFIGPGLNAANMAGRGWLDESRVWRTSERSINTVVQLRPLHRHDLPGFLAARLGEYFVEFRNRAAWDAAIPQPAILIHRFEDNISYLMSANNGQQALTKGGVFGTGDAANPILSPFTSETRIEVVEINANEEFAKVRLLYRPAFREPSLGPGISFGGVDEDGGGFIILGGKIVRVPPRSPLINVLEQVVAYESARSIASVQVQNAVRRETLSAIVDLARTQIQSIQAFHQPAPPQRIEALEGEQSSASDAASAE